MPRRLVGGSVGGSEPEAAVMGSEPGPEDAPAHRGDEADDGAPPSRHVVRLRREVRERPSRSPWRARLVRAGVGALVGLAVWWLFLRPPPGVRLSQDVVEEVRVVEEEFLATVKGFDEDRTPAEWLATIGDRLRRDTLPKYRALHARAAADASDDLGHALRDFLGARIGHLEALLRFAQEPTDANEAAVAAAVAQVARTGEAWKQRIPDAYRKDR